EMINDVTESTSENATNQQLPPHAFELFLVDTQMTLIESWNRELKKLPSKVSTKDPTPCLKVQLHNAPFQELLKTHQAECMVSPANSFGLMDGGIDYYISEYYGGVDKLIPLVQKGIDLEWCGEQNVGTCLLVDVGELVGDSNSADQGRKNLPRYIAHCPTMRTPKALDTEDDIVYRCTWAMLCAVRSHNAKVLAGSTKHQRINAVICAGFGTGVGGYPEKLCAKQMMLAIRNFIEAPANTGHRPKTESEGTWGSLWLIHWSYARKIESAVSALFRKDRPK
ncbi:6018_t:CDS:2, partial [Acaulospora colombiana]